jgi:soluble lytic murein transglycosylase-like protein
VASAVSPEVKSYQSAIRSAALSQGIDPSLALAIASKESGFNAHSTANGGVGIFQLVPGSSLQYAQNLLGRPLDPFNAMDSIAGGVAILKDIQQSTTTDAWFTAAYFHQGVASIQRNGLTADTAAYAGSIVQLMRTFR